MLEMEVEHHIIILRDLLVAGVVGRKLPHNCGISEGIFLVRDTYQKGNAYFPESVPHDWLGRAARTQG
jgi:hypothetical protein